MPIHKICSETLYRLYAFTVLFFHDEIAVELENTTDGNLIFMGNNNMFTIHLSGQTDCYLNLSAADSLDQRFNCPTIIQNGLQSYLDHVFSRARKILLLKLFL